MYRNKSVENLLFSSHEVLSSINSSSFGNVISSKSGNECLSEDNCDAATGKNEFDRNCIPSPSSSPQASPKSHNRREYWKNGAGSSNSSLKESENIPKIDDQSPVSNLEKQMHINSIRITIKTTILFIGAGKSFV